MKEMTFKHFLKSVFDLDIKHVLQKVVYFTCSFYVRNYLELNE